MTQDDTTGTTAVEIGAPLSPMPLVEILRNYLGELRDLVVEERRGLARHSDPDPKVVIVYDNDEELDEVEMTMDHIRREMDGRFAVVRDLITRERHERARRRALDGGGAVEFQTAVADNIRVLRQATQWTQADLARAMKRVGFPWTRVTVAEVERSGRRVGLDELLAIASLFGLPMVRLLYTRTDLAWPKGGSLSPRQVWAAVTGEGEEPATLIEVGEGGADWRPAIDVSGAPEGDEDWRPAPKLWYVATPGATMPPVHPDRRRD